MNRILIVGAGGHAAVVADILIACRAQGQAVEAIGFVDENALLVGGSVLGLPVLGGIESTSDIPHDSLIVAIGNNDSRRKLFEFFQFRGGRFAVACHPSVEIGSHVDIGEGTMISAGAVINCRSSVGPNTIVNTGATVDHDCSVGPHVHLAPGVRLGGGVRIGRGALIGIGAVVMPGRGVGNWATVGAGSLVHRDVEPDQTVVGVPARAISRQN
jgi:sugar O-acyltransferase (sialic acid O-acetyltransferase NeuD family)